MIPLTDKRLKINITPDRQVDNIVKLYPEKEIKGIPVHLPKAPAIPDVPIVQKNLIPMHAPPQAPVIMHDLKPSFISSNIQPKPFITSKSHMSNFQSQAIHPPPLQHNANVLGITNFRSVPMAVMSVPAINPLPVRPIPNTVPKPPAHHPAKVIPIIIPVHQQTPLSKPSSPRVLGLSETSLHGQLFAKDLLLNAQSRSQSGNQILKFPIQASGNHLQQKANFGPIHQGAGSKTLSQNSVANVGMQITRGGAIGMSSNRQTRTKNMGDFLRMAEMKLSSQDIMQLLRVSRNHQLTLDTILKGYINLQNNAKITKLFNENYRAKLLQLIQFYHYLQPGSDHQKRVEEIFIKSIDRLQSMAENETTLTRVGTRQGMSGGRIRAGGRAIGGGGARGGGGTGNAGMVSGGGGAGGGAQGGSAGVGGSASENTGDVEYDTEADGDDDSDEDYDD
jgi:hypothetical protein